MTLGFATPHQIAMAKVDDLSRIQGVSENKARQIIYAAREGLGMCEFVQVDQLQENYECPSIVCFSKKRVLFHA